jgi:hypothetical protein
VVRTSQALETAIEGLRESADSPKEPVYERSRKASFWPWVNLREKSRKAPCLVPKVTSCIFKEEDNRTYLPVFTGLRSLQICAYR